TLRHTEALLSERGHLVAALSSSAEANLLLDSVTPDLLIADLRVGEYPDCDPQPRESSRRAGDRDERRTGRARGGGGAAHRRGVRGVAARERRVRADGRDRDREAAARA